jgi:hypothetical protein
MKEVKKLGIAFTAGTLVTGLLAWSLILTTTPGDAKSADSKALEAEFQAMHLNCPKCHGDMEYGMIDDYFALGANSFDQAYWSASRMGKSPFAKSPLQRRIYSFRCVNCGYLESYSK